MQPDAPIRPASAPATNAIRGGTTNAVLTSVGTLVAAYISRNSDLSLEESALAVGAIAAVAGSLAAFVGSLARNVLHEQEAQPPEKRSGPLATTLLKAIGGTLG